MTGSSQAIAVVGIVHLVAEGDVETMISEPDASKAVCRVCGEVRALDTDAREAAADLAFFTAQHSAHDSFRIDVVTGPVVGTRSWRLPLQRCSCLADDAVCSA